MNVAAAVIPGAAPAPGEARAAAQIARRLASLFEEVVCVGSEPPADTRGRRACEVDGPPGVLRDIASALAAASAERVLVVTAGAEGVSPDLLLALVAWPEAEASGQGFTGQNPCRTQLISFGVELSKALPFTQRMNSKPLFCTVSTILSNREQVFLYNSCKGGDFRSCSKLGHMQCNLGDDNPGLQSSAEAPPKI